MKRYVPNENNGDATLALNSDKPWQFKKGEPRPPGSGRKKGTPNAVPGQLLEAIIEACARVGYDRGVYYKDKEGNIQVDESKRVQGLIPYIQRTAELHRKEMAAILGKIVTPAVVQLMVNNNNGPQAATTMSENPRI